MKMLINVPETVVADALRGMAAAHPELTVDVENRVIVRKDAPVAGKLGLVSGGGSGREPLHCRVVRPGTLCAACPGGVCTSPVPNQLGRAGAAVDVQGRVVARKAGPGAGRGGLVAGGGSGHEPLNGGFVGPGMLSGACPGEVFTSPVPAQMVRAAVAEDSGAGVLFSVKNSTGD